MCAHDDGRRAVLGFNDHDDLGTTDHASHSARAAVSTSLAFQSIAAGNQHTCALATDGKAYCWGHNSNGQLGTGDFLDRPAPTPVVGNLMFRSLVAGRFHTCG
ncbi:MAG: hypothetical protein M3154_09960, partial [Candidatus Eremiobacteraeota bacterium]|nr:hypothetical protein [Candidatus Eremiobacteraeota bacterium]